MKAQRKTVQIDSQIISPLIIQKNSGPMSPFQSHAKQQLSQDGGEHHAGTMASPLIEPQANVRSLRSIPGNFDIS